LNSSNSPTAEPIGLLPQWHKKAASTLPYLLVPYAWHRAKNAAKIHRRRGAAKAEKLRQIMRLRVRDGAHAVGDSMQEQQAQPSAGGQPAPDAGQPAEAFSYGSNPPPPPGDAGFLDGWFF